VDLSLDLPLDLPLDLSVHLTVCDGERWSGGGSLARCRMISYLLLDSTNLWSSFYPALGRKHVMFSLKYQGINKEICNTFDFRVRSK
jgi:hypothetical protein